MDILKPNTGKNLEITINHKKYARYPIKTHIITAEDDIVQVVEKYVKPHLKPNDLIFISERIVAISQGRAFPIKDINPSKLANFLVKFVHKSPYGIGLKSPWTMELAIREAGACRILFAASLSAITKPLGFKGIFYKAVGKNINAIDGPCSYTLPPYNEYAKLGPANPNKVAKKIKLLFGNETIIIDANDLGAAILGKSEKSLSNDFLKQLFKDNPLGQSKEQTPICLVRPLN
jgi:hypothetical protein